MDRIKELLKQLDEFDDMQISGVIAIVEEYFTKEQIDKFIKYLVDEKTSKTRNDIYDYTFKEANMDLTPYSIVD